MRDTNQGDQLREAEGLLYPDIDDNTFLSKLLRKREFRETQQSKITNETLKDNVCEAQEFEYTAVQKFVAQFMSPDTPYNGMLLYHGVGVGKTCTAVLTAEAFLELSPKNKVYILAPPAIQPGFYRTIFDSSRIKFGSDSDEPNQHEGCTGNRYLELTQTQFEREKKDIELRVNRLINKRYSIMGYVAFRNMVNDILSQIPSTLPPERKRQQETRLLQKALSGSLFIVDEAHNLRDISDIDDETDQIDDAGGMDEKGDAAAGKKLTPFLKKVLRTCEGNKLLLMTATPMYNSYKEIISLLNFLLHVDHVDESELLRESDIKFQMTEAGEQLTPKSEARIIKVANGHVSFMRGENPKAFPARLDPADAIRIKTWPAFAPNGTTAIEPARQKEDVIRLPLVKCELTGEPLAVIQSMTERLVAAKGVGIRTIDTLLQAGNFIFPGEGLEGRVGSEGFQTWFTSRGIPGSFEGTRLSTLPQYSPADPSDAYLWMGTGKNLLGKCSPKYNQILQTIKNASGISFVYSRFVENGAVIFCLALEANGYTAWGRSAPLFSKGPVTPGGRQCAKCDKRESGHPAFSAAAAESRENHKFAPAYYALLTASSINTGDKQSLPLSPNNTRVITAARDLANSDGSKIKVIVGSQVAGEGLDLRAIREIHILEGWFHLSKEEQIVGRGIRYCSHQGLEYKYRNCTINLYANVFPAELNKETIDQYSYRTAMNKAVRVGNVSRALRQGAADCNLSREAILVSGLSDVEMVDSQRQTRTVNLNDKDYTPICDWIRCDYQCKPSIDVKALPEDNGTYDIFAARFAEQSMISRLKRLFKEQVWFRWEDIQEIFKDIPKVTLTSLLLRAVGNPSITFENGDLQGHLVYRNNLFIFQPSTIQDQAVPLAMRYGRYPVKRDSYEPAGITAAPPPTIYRTSLPAASPGTVAPAPLAPGTTSTTAVTLAPLAALSGTVAAAAAPMVAPTRVNIDAARNFWKVSNIWIDSWAKDAVPSITEQIPNTEAIPLTSTIMAYVEKDASKKDNIETRLKKLQWWGQAIINSGTGTGMADLRLIARQFIWDSFLKGVEQMELQKEGVEYAEVAAEPFNGSAGSVKAYRYMDHVTKEPAYMCSDGICPPSVLQLFTSSKTDEVINAVANQRTASELYGFMVPWENTNMFKTNTPSPEGKPPGGGAACSIVSNVSGHRKKLVELGTMLAQTHDGKAFDLTEHNLSVVRKLQGAPNFCALTEIVLRWMDVRRSLYGGRRFFYRPLAAYYSKHKSKK
jgi:Type III restriction enzyme, res subunit